ncbi:MAG: TonB-dependent receptor [Opitutaceae bacterium]|nr:TonB-dependent receptor [Opitutaceae bacterium]
MPYLIPRFGKIRAALGALGAILVLASPLTIQAQTGTGTITGRILNQGTGQYLRSATVTVAGTSVSTVAESGGVYTLTGVPAGDARLVVSYAGLDPAEATVLVGAGQTVTRDFSMGSKADDAVVKLGEFRVTTERDGNFQAIQEQKSALEIKQVVASDAFGDVSEGNVGEFMKLMPGVMLDYVDADVRTVSIGGLDPKYATILMDGAPIASAGSSSIGTGRAFEFEQLSISSIETVELSKTPTPDVSGSALAGVVNLRSRGAFDRKGRLVRWSASTGINSHQATLQRTPGPSDRKLFKLQPNGSLEYSDVFRERLGVIAGVSFSRTMGEQNLVSHAYTANNDASDNATEIPRLNNVSLIDAPKITSRGNYNLRLDYKLSPDVMVWGRIDYNTYSARNYQRNAALRFNNAINGQLATDPRDPAVEYSLNSQTSTNATSEFYSGNGFNKHGATVTPALGATYRRGAFRADAQAQMSRSTNYYHTVEMGFFDTATTSQLPGLTLRWDRENGGDEAINITQLAGPDWRRLENYTFPARMNLRTNTGKDQKWTAKTDLRYSWQSWKIPAVLKWGGDISEQIRNVDRFQPANPSYTYLGPDQLPNTGDERWTPEAHYSVGNLAGGNLQDLPALDRFWMAREFGAHPERFVQPSDEQKLLLALRNHWDIKEQIDSAYSQLILKVTPRFDLAPGVRVEKTRSSARGPTDRGDNYAKLVLTGNPLANIPTTTAEYYQARYGTDAVNSSDYHTWLKYLHATYRLTSDIVFRASFNDSITRPNLNNLASGVTVNEDVIPPTANIPNPGLQPEHGRNLFFSAEYYFPKRAGFFTVSGSRRDITNLIRSNRYDLDPDEDFPNQDGLDLRGFRVTTVENIGKAHVSTVEFSYRQNMVFLPGIWKRLSVFGNYTVLHFDDYENFRRPENLANGGISFDHPRGFTFRWNFVWVPIYRPGAVSTSTTARGWVAMNGERSAHDMQLGYRFSPRATFFVNARNIFNRPQRTYWGPNRTDILIRHSDYGAFWTVGVRGQF